MNHKPGLSDLTAAPAIGRNKKRHKKNRKLAVLLFVLLVLSLLMTLFSAWFFLTSSGTRIRFIIADSVITTQHRVWAKYLIGQSELDRRVAEYDKRFDQMAAVPVQNPVHVPEQAAQTEEKQPLIRIEPVSGKGYKGYLLFVSDPKALRIVVPERVGKGEKVSSMVKRTGALAGVNAGGFADPNWKGNGFQPIGVVMSGGSIYYNDSKDDAPAHIVGIDQNGRLLAGKYKPSELRKMGVKEAVSFAPRFIVNGEGMIKNEEGGWGIAPRTSIAQKEDGTIMFAIIDGRQPGSIGATLYDVQQLFLQHGAVIAANLDGGSSTVLVTKENGIVNHPSSEYGERYLPTAWLVFEHADEVKVKNIWQGLDIKKIDPAKW